MASAQTGRARSAAGAFRAGAGAARPLHPRGPRSQLIRRLTPHAERCARIARSRTASGCHVGMQGCIPAIGARNKVARHQAATRRLRPPGALLLPSRVLRHPQLRSRLLAVAGPRAIFSHSKSSSMAVRSKTWRTWQRHFVDSTRSMEIQKPWRRWRLLLRTANAQYVEHDEERKERERARSSRSCKGL